MPPKKEEPSKASGKGGKDSDKKKDEKEKKEVAPPPPPPPPSPLEVLHRNLVLIDKFVDTRDRIHLARALRYTGFLREHASINSIRKVVDTYVLVPARKEKLLECLSAISASRLEKSPTSASFTGDSMETDVTTTTASTAIISTAAAPAGTTTTPVGTATTTTPITQPQPIKLPKPGGAAVLELEAYLHVLILSMLSTYTKDMTALHENSTRLLQFLAPHNRRTLDFFQGKAWTYLALASELPRPLAPAATMSASASSSSSSSSAATASSGVGAGAGASSNGTGLAASNARGLADLQEALMTAYRTACLRHDEYGQAILLNLLLRSYLESKDIETAASLMARTVFPEAASSSQLVRFMYYSGRVKAIQLEYSDAYNSLMQALRKAPPAALGFRILVQKFALIVQMLMGEIPERATFDAKDMRIALVPYLELTRAVRAGDVRSFQSTVTQFLSVFTRDGTISLIRRLESNVIKTGLRRIATSYSCIHFSSIATKLNLSSAEDAEFLSAKAIRDGVIDAVLDHDAGTLKSVGAPNVYSGKDPQEAFHRRINFCLDVHNEAVRAMRYPANAARPDLEGAEERREREKEEAEFINDLEEGKGFDEDDDE